MVPHRIWKEVDEVTLPACKKTPHSRRQTPKPMLEKVVVATRLLTSADGI